MHEKRSVLMHISVYLWMMSPANQSLLLEICCYTPESAASALQGGAQRIELCAGAGLGGTTPAEETISRVCAMKGISVFVMIRPRGGNFFYSEEEFITMQSEILFAKQAGAHGVVFGILNENKTVDIKRCRILAELASPMDITFHKAFDETPDPLKALDDVYAAGIKRILTSGTKAAAEQGIEIIRKLLAHANGRVKIMVGGGLRSTNLEKFKPLGIREFHSSAISANDDSYKADFFEITKMVFMLNHAE